ncbi:peptidoglycan -binding protein [Parvibaculum sedimenti]|uniref:Peptidoglycan-binding protein n=1 Tax=Parvibaculum sedimenti TaxID=2608632 RepID=A0A6N6VI99_9HYPH|nr:peptidoglycan -binding protein [Parvibaculum sedimenti]KAB7740786.1 peptidoglycan -binding protein [Parvibaculum sedimenti]
MAPANRRIRGRAPSADYWPGFVDAMSSLLLVLIFLLTIFMLTQFFLSQLVSSKDTALENLRSQIAELVSQLALVKQEKADLQLNISSLQASLAAANAEKEKLGAQAGTGAQVTVLQDELSKQKDISNQALAQVELLNQQIAAMRRQLAALEEALNASEKRDKESQAQIADLGRRLNAALAQKVQELARYRSEFFGRLREILGNRPDIEIVGDRFVIQSEILFDSGSAEINPSGIEQLRKITEAVKQIGGEIPSDIPWVLRIDGHTDVNPIHTPQFPSNWYLSSARAIAVVDFMVKEGVAPNHLVAAGFGEFQPLDKGSTPDALKRNRRIEFKLTER